MSLDRTLVGLASLALTGAAGMGVSISEQARLLNLPPVCADVISKNASNEIIKAYCPPGTTDSSMVGIILFSGIIFTVLLLLTPVGDFIVKMFKGETT